MTSRAYVEFEDNPEDCWKSWNVCFKARGKSKGSSLSTSDDILSGSGWPEEIAQRCPDWTEALKGWPLRETVGQPTRLLHIKSGDVVYPEQPVQYAAVSYVWDQWEGKIEDILCRLKSLMDPAGLEYCWVDQLCIQQDSPKDKGNEIKRMKEYYANAAVTYVMVPEWSARFTWEVAGFSMAAEQAEIAGMEVNALEKTMWASRIWTFQEASLSGRTVFVGSSVVKSAVELVVANTLDKFRDHRSHLLRKGAEMNEAEDGFVHAVWRRKADGGTKITGGNSQECSIASATQLLRDRVVLDETHAETEYDYIDEIWVILGERHCKKEEDKVYGMLGLVRRGNEVVVEYGIGFEEAVKRAADKGLVSQRVFLAVTRSPKLGRSWCPALGTERRFRKSHWQVNHRPGFKELRLTAEGLCEVQGAGCRPRDPERPERIQGSCPKFLFEGGREFIIDFKEDLPRGVEWQRDWLAVVEGPFQYHSIAATLIKYKIGEDGRLEKLEALGVHIRKPWPHGNDTIAAHEIATRDFLLS